MQNHRLLERYVHDHCENRWKKTCEANLLFAIISLINNIIIVFSLNETPNIELYINMEKNYLHIFYGAQNGSSPKKGYLPKTRFLRTYNIYLFIRWEIPVLGLKCRFSVSMSQNSNRIWHKQRENCSYGHSTYKANLIFLITPTDFIGKKTLFWGKNVCVCVCVWGGGGGGGDQKSDFQD